MEEGGGGGGDEVGPGRGTWRIWRRIKVKERLKRRLNKGKKRKVEH